MDLQAMNVRGLAVGEYDFAGPKGEKYRYLDTYDDRTGETVRFSLDKDCVSPAIEFGSLLNLWLVIQTGEKIIRSEEEGRPRDRSFATTKLRVLRAEVVGVASKKAA